MPPSVTRFSRSEQRRRVHGWGWWLNLVMLPLVAAAVADAASNKDQTVVLVVLAAALAFWAASCRYVLKLSEGCFVSIDEATGTVQVRNIFRQYSFQGSGIRAFRIGTISPRLYCAKVRVRGRPWWVTLAAVGPYEMEGFVVEVRKLAPLVKVRLPQMASRATWTAG
jgi:hypothetical protein